MTLTNKNCNQTEIKSWWNSEKACDQAAQNLLSSRVQSETFRFNPLSRMVIICTSRFNNSAFRICGIGTILIINIDYFLTQR
jgi:hypothetical protein